MRRAHDWLRQTILAVVDWFYPFFRRFMPQQTYRYAACGGFNTVLDILLFFVGYNYVFHKEPIPVYGSIIITPHIAAFLFAFLFTFPIGFYLSRYVVWQQTDTGKREQLMKYFIVVFGCIGLNYMFLKILVEFFGWYPTPAKILTTVFVVMFSYLSQKNYTFKA